MNYGYIRVSTEHQDASAEAQAAKLEPLCDRLYIDRDVSGSIPLRKRPEGKQMWDALLPDDTVVITTRDRAFRNLLDAVETLQQWQEMGIRLRILDFPIDLSTDEGQMMFQILTVFASYERAQTKRRTKAVLAHKRASGQPYGQLRPFGLRRKGDGWEPFPQERAIADYIAQLKESGASWSAVVLDLCQKDIRKPYCRRGARGYYSQADVRGLFWAREAGYPVRSQESWQAPGSSRTQRAG